MFRRQNPQQTSVLPLEVLLTCSNCGRVLGNNASLATGKHSWARPQKKKELPGSWCCSLHCNLSHLYLGSKNLHLHSKIRRDTCIGTMMSPTQASSGLELKALLHKSTCIVSFCKAIPLLHWTHLAMTPWSVQKCKAFPQWVLTENVLLSSRLKGAITFQRDIIHEEYEWHCILHLTCLTDLLKLIFPGVMDMILYSYPPLWDRTELWYFPIKPSRRRSNN